MCTRALPFNGTELILEQEADPKLLEDPLQGYMDNGVSVVLPNSDGCLTRCRIIVPSRWHCTKIK